MVTDTLLRRIDAFLLVFGSWCFLSLVVASIAVMALNVFVGVLSLAVVVLVTAVGVASYLSAG